MKSRGERFLTLLFLCCIGILLMSSVCFAKTSGAVPAAQDNLVMGLKSKSELVPVNGGYMRVYYDGTKVGIEYYDNQFRLKSKKSVAMELSIWGGFYAGTDAYYLVEGQANTKEKDNAEVIRVIRYDTNWKKKGTARITGNSELFGGEVRYPFDYGCVEMAEYKDMLYIVTGHQGYVDPAYNQGHQGFLMAAVNKDTMKGVIVNCDLWHSFAQYIACRDSNIYVLEQSEGSRYTKLSRYDAKDLKKTSIKVLEYGGSHTSAWAIACYASVDGMAVSDSHVLCLGTSIDQSKYDSVSSDTAHNIYLTVTPASDFTEDATRVKWITKYKGGGKSFLGAKITRINDNRFMISWEETDTSRKGSADDALSSNILHYIFVDGKGNKVSKEYKAAAPISDCQPVVKKSKVVYYASSANMVNFYSIDAQTGAFHKKVYRVAGKDAVWNIKNGVLKISGTGTVSIDGEVHYRYPVSSTAGGYVYSSNDNAWKPVREKVKKIVIQKGITQIAKGTFKTFHNLTEVKIENGLKRIGKEAFYGCSALTKITIPSSVTSIGADFLWTGSYWYNGDHVVRASICAPYNSYAVKYAKKKGIIYKMDISAARISGIKSKYPYNGKARKPAVTVKCGSKKLKRGTDYTVSYAGNVKRGKATVKIKGIGSYEGMVTKTFKIV